MLLSIHLLPPRTRPQSSFLLLRSLARPLVEVIVIQLTQSPPPTYLSSQLTKKKKIRCMKAGGLQLFGKKIKFSVVIKVTNYSTCPSVVLLLIFLSIFEGNLRMNLTNFRTIYISSPKYCFGKVTPFLLLRTARF